MIILQELNPLVNGPFRRIRQLMKALPNETLMTADYHQFMTDGLVPEKIMGLLCENNLECKIEYTNTALIDELCIKFGRGVGWLLSPLGLLRSKFLCLNYSILAKSNRGK